MSAGVLAAPGTENGPCNAGERGPNGVVLNCGHADCQTTRIMAATVCRYCCHPIGYERRFYAHERSYVHASCLEARHDEGRR